MKSICADLVSQRLTERGGLPLNRQLYECVRGIILDGSLPAGAALPASRDLAQELGVSRNTVTHAYEQLRAEGYVEARVGSGTFVADITPDSLLSAPRAASHDAPAPSPVRLSKRGQALLADVAASPVQWGAFMPGVPDVTQFPNRAFSRILARLWRKPSPQLLTYAHGGGHLALRQALADHLRVARSVQCDADQILITEGVHQAIDMTLRMLADPRDVVWVEDPGYWGFHKLLSMTEARVRPMRMDGDGGMEWPAGRTPPRLIFVTPSHQYPLGSVMTLARRRELVEHARACGGWIVEDDYDSEFRFSGRPIPAMQGLDAQAPVIYIGSFSKTLFPALRVGYMVLPKALAPAFRSAHGDLYRAGHAITQVALAELIREGHYASHIRRMRLVYARRRAILLQLVQSHLGTDALAAQDSNAGLHLILHLPDSCDDAAIAERALREGVLTRPLSRYYLGANPRRGLLLGYACVQDEEMAPAFMRLLECIRKTPSLSRRART